MIYETQQHVFHQERIGTFLVLGVKRGFLMCTVVSESACRGEETCSGVRQNK